MFFKITFMCPMYSRPAIVCEVPRGSLGEVLVCLMPLGVTGEIGTQKPHGGGVYGEDIRG